MRGFITGIVFTIVLLVAAAYVGVQFGMMPAGADAKPFPLEEWAAKRSLHSAMAREDAGYENPLQPTDQNLIAGVHLYAANCAVCHGAADAAQSTLSKGFYIEAPQLAKDGVEDDPDKMTFWKLKHGIRFSAMPAFGGTLSDDDLWKLTTFLSKMDKLPPAAEAEWKKVPSATASPAP
jgi:mono/diheme cytochrome c family protein